jgi:hypothetical protein
MEQRMGTPAGVPDRPLKPWRSRFAGGDRVLAYLPAHATPIEAIVTGFDDKPGHVRVAPVNLPHVPAGLKNRIICVRESHLAFGDFVLRNEADRLVVRTEVA